MPNIRYINQKSAVDVDGTVIGHVESWRVNKNNDAFPSGKISDALGGRVKCPDCGSTMVYNPSIVRLSNGFTWSLICPDDNCRERKPLGRYEIAKKRVKNAH